MTRIAFLGLGRMGIGMASRLKTKGHDVVVWNRSPEKARPVLELGARLAPTPAEAATGAEAVFTMLADDQASKAVWLGPSGALAAMQPGTTAIECSTLTRRCVLDLAAKAEARGIRFIDCPVTGRPSAAAAGQLTLLIGADPADLAAIRPLLEEISETIRHFGAVGTGTAYKLMINLMGSVQIAALAEGLVMAEKLGLDREEVIKAIETSASASRQVVQHCRRMAERNFTDPTFTAGLRHKDAAYGVALAKEVGALAALGEASLAWFAAAKAMDADADEGIVIDAVSGEASKLTNLSPGPR